MDPGDPPPEAKTHTTQLLRRSVGGDAGGTQELLARVYDELHRLAEGYLGRERKDHTLQPTALVHEAYLRLIDQEAMEWNDEVHFLATAARAMRNLLVDHARAKRRVKRGGGWQRVDLDQAVNPTADESLDLTHVDRALTKLGELSERKAKIVELRFFAGLAVDDVAKVMDLSPRTVAREWRFARAWLSRALREEAEDSE